MDHNWPSRMDHDTSTYWQQLAARKLSIARCEDCGHWMHPPRGCCSACWSNNIGHQEPSGKARLYSYVVQSVAPGAAPSVIGWAELDEQKQLFVVAPIENATAETVCIGAPLTLDWNDSDNIPLPVFRQEARS